MMGLIQAVIVLLSVNDCAILRTYRMNCEGYPDDEAASMELLEFRHREANSLFLAYYEDPGVPCAVSCTAFSSTNSEGQYIHQAGHLTKMQTNNKSPAHN